MALLLLRYCCSFGKLVYSLRLTPHSSHDHALHNFDLAVRDCFETFLCLHTSTEEWTLATLSTKLGGLGLRSTEGHSSAAYLASRCTALDACQKLDADY